MAKIIIQTNSNEDIATIDDISSSVVDQQTAQQIEFALRIAIRVDIESAIAFQEAKARAEEECTCQPDLPDGRMNAGSGELCPACSARADRSIPFS